VVLVCSKAGSLEQEAELAEVARLAQASGLAYQIMYVSEPDTDATAEPLASRRRSLLAAATGFGPYTECGAVCQTQVGGAPAGRPGARGRAAARRGSQPTSASWRRACPGEPW
jgi:hypothetical protein